MTQALTVFLKAFLEGLKDNGVKEVVLSPGSRSTPLAVLIQADSELKCFMDVDERSAAFFALGMSKTLHRPVACVCTSGTAAANYFPAICEAEETQVPLIILTTDRPHELRHVGAPQTMNQTNLYGDKVKFSVEMPLPEESPNMLQYSYSQAFQLVNRALTVKKGPVHANFPFREPLLPDSEVGLPQIRRKKVYRSNKLLDKVMLEELLKSLSDKKGWLVIGESSDINSTDIMALADKLKWPVLTDPLANIRTTGDRQPSSIAHYDGILMNADLPDDFMPEVIIRMGRLSLSKSLNQLLTRFDGDYLLIDETGQIADASHRATTILEINPQAFISQSLEVVQQSSEVAWLKKWQQLDDKVHDLLNQTEFAKTYSEGQLITKLVEKLPTKSQLFLSNSMPIRDVDTLLSQSAHQVTLHGNRGINGIDGIISSAFGMASSHPDKWNGLVIGDLSFFHSLNGCALGKNYQLPLTIFVVNNNGGGIFSMLSQSSLPETIFEPLFGTPQNLDFEKVAELFNCEYQRVIDTKTLEEAIDLAVAKPTFRIVEIMTIREENIRMRKEMNQFLKAELKQVFGHEG